MRCAFPPYGLVDPQTGRQPFAVVQLRAENREGALYNLVGFQTKLKYGAQERVFRLIPGLSSAEFVRLGSIHRNTFIHSPGLLAQVYQNSPLRGSIMAETGLSQGYLVDFIIVPLVKCSM